MNIRLGHGLYGFPNHEANYSATFMAKADLVTRGVPAELAQAKIIAAIAKGYTTVETKRGVIEIRTTFDKTPPVELSEAEEYEMESERREYLADR